jgi:hypothetical protein
MWGGQSACTSNEKNAKANNFFPLFFFLTCCSEYIHECIILRTFELRNNNTSDDDKNEPTSTHHHSEKKTMSFEKFGNTIPFTEPYWYQGFHSPYYTANHVAFRAKVRAFVESELKPHVDEWLDAGVGYPRELHEKAYAAGLGGLIYPREYGGTRPDDFDPFYELIMIDEMARMGGATRAGSGRDQ